jgi:Cof subfamily protein (haloacid dehalogenase superfamily)
MYKALITDLDGTAVALGSHGEDIDVYTQATIRQAQEAGYLIACATGRDWSETKPVVQGLGLNALCIISGGSAIIDPRTNEITWEMPLEPGSSQEVFSVFKKFSKSGNVYMPSEAHEIPLIEVHEVPNELRNLYLLDVPLDVGQTVADEINKLDRVIAHLTPSWEGAGFIDVHVTHFEATKEHAIKAWHELTGVTVDETIGMGDSGNDLPLLNASGLKVAVGNATEVVKERADYIAPNATDQALGHVIEKFLLSQT